MSIRSAIADALRADPDAETAVLAAAIVAHARKGDFLPLVEDEIELQRRHTTRNLERSAVGRRFRAAFVGKQADAVAALQDDQHRAHLSALMRRSWRLGDGTTIDIGQAGLDEIRQRLELLRKQAAGLGESIRVLEAIEAELVRTGAKCLDDLLSKKAEAA